jgi:hypothetical protein
METIIVKDLSTDSSSVTVSEKSSRGRTGIVWRSDWVGTSDYYVGDAVAFSNRSYFCKKFISSSTSNTPIIATDNWDILVDNSADNSLPYWHVDPTSGSFLPDANETYSIGSPTSKIKELHLSGDTIYLGDATLSSEDEGVKVESVVLGSGDTTIKLGVTGNGKLSQESTVSGEVQPVVEGVDSIDVNVSSYNSIPEGNLQNALKYLEDKAFQQETEPTGSTVKEGDLWYNTITDRMNVYRNNTWETLVTSPALAADTGYDDISMNGGFF